MHLYLLQRSGQINMWRNFIHFASSVVLRWERAKQDKLLETVEKLDLTGGIVKPQSFRECGLLAEDYLELGEWLIAEVDNLKSFSEVNAKLRELYFFRWALWHQEGGIANKLIHPEYGMQIFHISIHGLLFIPQLKKTRQPARS